MRFALVLAVFLTAAVPAQAGLSVCNKGARPAKVAVGLFDGTRWVSRGWWHIDGKKCAELIAGKLAARYYYLYATDGGAGIWGGGKSFCTAGTDQFAIVGRGGCSERGYDRRGFFEIDTANQLDFTQSLSD